MSAYVRKTVNEWEVQGYYGAQYGWETVTTAATWPEARTDLRCYRENEPRTAFRVRVRRVRIEAP